MNVTLRVDISGRGAWEVALSDRGEQVRCETLEEASRVAYRCAVDRRPSELIVCDAYHRVVHRELIDGREDRRRMPSETSEPGPTRAEPNLRGSIRRTPIRR
jgi:hypothetical protein